MNNYQKLLITAAVLAALIIATVLLADLAVTELGALLHIVGQARRNPTDYPTTVAIRIADLHEWIELYRADLAKQ